MHYSAKRGIVIAYHLSVRLSGGVEKSGVLERKSGNVSETLEIEEKLLRRAYRNSPTLF